MIFITSLITLSQNAIIIRWYYIFHFTNIAHIIVTTLTKLKIWWHVSFASLTSKWFSCEFNLRDFRFINRWFHHWLYNNTKWNFSLLHYGRFISYSIYRWTHITWTTISFIKCLIKWMYWGWMIKGCWSSWESLY